MNRSKTVKIILIVLLSVFLIHQLYSTLYSPIKTESAEFISYTDGLGVSGIIIRSEATVQRSESGVMHFKVTDGERVAKNGVVADIYTNEADSVTVSKINDIKNQIESLNTIQSYNDLAAVDINLLNGKINEELSKIIFAAGQGDFTSSYKYNNELLTMLNRKTMVTGESYDFSNKLAELNAELASLEASLKAPVADIKAQESGFFVSSVDGFESVLTTDDLSKFTPSFLDNLSAENAKENKIGKIVSDYTWYIAVTVDESIAQEYNVGENAKLHTSLKNNPDLSVVVAAVNKDTFGRATIIFACKEMDTELATIRTLPVTLVDGIYDGLKVKKSALRFVDGERGVFVISGMELKFVKVNVIYNNEEFDYAICEKANDVDKTVLRLYDKVVTKGKNLYDGKIIN